MVAALLPLPGAVFLSAKPALPLTLVAQASANFTVSFQASTTGGYSAALSSDGLSVLLTAAVEPGLTYEVQTASGTQPLAASPIDFGSVQVGQTRSRHAVVTNRMQQTPNFSCDGCRDRRFQPARSTARRYIPTTGQRSGFDVQFLLSGTGLRTASLAVESRIYTLTGTGVAPLRPN